jgi:glycosyltransferase involved in cell wall biosynthesis
VLIIKRKLRGVFCDSTALDRKYSTVKHILKSIFFQQCHVVFCYGERSKRYVMEHGVREDRIVFRCQAAALPKNYSPQCVLDRRKAEIATVPRFLYVGRLSPEKNLGALIKAFAKVRRSHSKATLRLVGEGPLRRALEVEAGATKDSGVIFVGSLVGDKLESEYVAATALVLPSLSEPWGLVVNEALSYGCPVIVSDRCGCVPELVVNGETGFVINPSDVADIAEKLEMTLSTLKGRSTAEACVNRIALFSPERAAQQIIDGVEMTLRRGYR